MSLHVVASIDEVPPGTRKIVEVAGREIGIFNVAGNFFAVRNRCPHMAGPLCEGYASGAVTSTGPGDYHFDRDGEILRCPWHQWEFDMRTGQSWFDPARVRVRAYRARVESGASLMASESSATAGPTRSHAQRPGRDVADPDIAAGDDGDPPEPPAGMIPGPYVAETYPVSVDRAYIVIDLSSR